MSRLIHDRIHDRLADRCYGRLAGRFYGSLPNRIYRSLRGRFYSRFYNLDAVVGSKLEEEARK